MPLPKDPIKAEEVKRRMRENALKRWADPEYRQKRADSLKRPEVIEKKKISRIKLWRDPDYRERVMKSMTKDKVRCICETCGKEYYVSPSVIRQGQGKHCSQECRRNKVLVKCDMCGKDFFKRKSEVVKNKRNFCCKDCLNKWRGANPQIGEDSNHWQGGKTWNERVCLYCGKLFLTKHKDGKFCSKNHRNLWMSENLRSSNSPHFKQVPVNCKQCGKEFLVKPFRLKRNKFGLYCSNECKNTWITQHPGKEHPSFKSEFVDCVVCGKEFKLTPHWKKLGRDKYCSQECYWQDLETGGTREYCEKWTAELRFRIAIFWGNVCSICGERQEDHDKTFHKHHVYYNKQSCCIKNEDGTFSNLGIWNNPSDFKINGTPNKFALLCPGCHRKTSGKNKRVYYARMLEELINNKHGGHSYYSHEEMIELGWKLSGRNKWVRTT